MKKTHNKKRNTAFVYEALVRELTKSILSKNKKTQNIVYDILVQFFSKNKPLHEELSLYKSICSVDNLDKNIAEKVLNEAKIKLNKLNKKELYIEQSKLIGKINKSLSKAVFDNFIPNYRNLATLHQIFNDKVDVKQKVILEQQVTEWLSKDKETKKIEETKELDKLTYLTFIKKFNEVYGSVLIKEQKELIGRYVLLNEENKLEFKVYLNEEIGRLKKELQIEIEKNTLEDNDILEKMKETYKFLESLKNEKNIDDLLLEKIMKIQLLISEIKENDNKS